VLWLVTFFLLFLFRFLPYFIRFFLFCKSFSRDAKIPRRYTRHGIFVLNLFSFFLFCPTSPNPLSSFRRVTVKEKLLTLKEQQKENRLACGNCYVTKYQSYIYLDEIGERIRPDYISGVFPDLLKKNGLRHIRFHDTRHSCASLLLKNGVSMKEIQAWLGHSDYGTTANLYAHLDVEMSKIQSAQKLSAGLFGSSVEKNKELPAQY